MPDFEEQEREAYATGAKLMAEVMTVIGWETRLHELNRDQALALVEAAVNGYFHHMRGLVLRPSEDLPFP